jgi:hypothetical protein
VGFTTQVPARAAHLSATPRRSRKLEVSYPQAVRKVKKDGAIILLA